MNSNCDNLDAYLSDDLPAADAARFADHLLGCDDCREAIDQQQWIEGLLQSPLRSQLEPVPERVVEGAHTSLARSERRRTRVLVGALATAAAITVAVGWIELNRQASDGTMQGTGRASLATSDNPREKERPRATFVSYSNAIAVPIASRHPDVTVVRVYPTFRPRYEKATAALEPEATTNANWNIYSNGG